MAVVSELSCKNRCRSMSLVFESRMYKLKNREEILGCSKTYLEVTAVISEKHHMESCPVDQHLAYKMEKETLKKTPALNKLHTLLPFCTFSFHFLF
ncbi:hypothetical protein T4D_2189 [Trichinella pseudospiralis]|uniref:FLYWCH-type domain-containing protein n=1 Tax=Trichinella pseudospiralis TaxID=6337 RepID=A0A0V1G1S3_TRIPS|nr:hypothetical protein T4D_2189 [Trichinella pseudospiralis]